MPHCRQIPNRVPCPHDKNNNGDGAPRLTRLTEFAGFDPGPDFLLTRYAPELANRSILVRIGNQDTRVGTDAAVHFAQTVGAKLVIVDSPGHDVPEDGSTAQWLVATQP